MRLISFTNESVETFTQEFEQLFNDKNADAMTAHYAPDGQIALEGLTPVRGHAAIHQFWRHAIEMADTVSARRTIHLQEATESGDLAYALCVVNVEVPNPFEPTAPTAIASWDTTVWRRDGDGVWRIAVDISVHLPRPLDQPVAVRPQVVSSPA